MWESFKNALKNGINVPIILDDGKPSTTLTFAYTTFVLAIIAEVYFLFTGDTFTATCTAIIFWALAMVWYRLRRLDKVRFDLDDKEIELSGGSEDDEK